MQFKYQNLQLPHALSCLAISCCTACFAIFWWNDTKLSGTIFPRIFWLRLGLYGGSALFELGIFLLFRFAPQHACKHAVAIHMLFCEWMAVILSFDPHRVIALVSPDTSYARELAQWWALYNPDPGSFKTECGGYVIDGEQLCYFNSFEAIYLIMIMCVMAVSGFYFRVPPCSFLVQVHLTIATRIAIVSVYGSVNTKSTVDIMDTVCFSVGLLLLYFAVRRNDAQHRATFFQLQLTRQEMGESTERLTGEKERLAWELNMTVSRLVQQPERDGSGCGSGRALEDDDGAPAAALMSLPVAVHANGHEEEEEPVVEATRVGRWAGEITLFYPTTTTLGEDTISLWTDANEADFRDSMFHSGFKWRVSMVAAVAVVVLTVLLLDSCLTVQGAFTMSIQAVMLLTEVVAQRMADRRRARELGVGSIICLFIAFGIGSCFTANLAASGDTPTWDGAQCTNERLATRTMQLYNLLVGPCGVFIGVLVTSMTISVGGFVALFVGYLVPCAAAYLLVGLSLPDITVDGSPLTPMPGVIVGAAFIFGCYFAGVVIGGIYTFLQRRAAITTAEMRVERLNVRVAQLAREKERLDYERQMAQQAAARAWSPGDELPDGGSESEGEENPRHVAGPSETASNADPQVAPSRSRSSKPPSTAPSRTLSKRSQTSSKASSKASSKTRRARLLGRFSSPGSNAGFSVATSATDGELQQSFAESVRSGKRKDKKAAGATSGPTAGASGTLADVSRPAPGQPHPLTAFVLAVRGQRPHGKMPGQLPAGWESPSSPTLDPSLPHGGGLSSPNGPPPSRSTGEID